MSIDGTFEIPQSDRDGPTSGALLDRVEAYLEDQGVRSIRREARALVFDAGWVSAWGLRACHGSFQILSKADASFLSYHLSYGRWAVLAGLLVPALFAVLFRLAPEMESWLLLAGILILMPITWLLVMIVPHRWLAVASLRRIKAFVAISPLPEGVKA